MTVLRELTSADVDALQELIESDPEYTQRITGYPPSDADADAQSLLMMRPDGVAEEVCWRSAGSTKPGVQARRRTR
jgi:uncharacterized protein